LQYFPPARAGWNPLPPELGPEVGVVDEIAELLFLPIFARTPVAVSIISIDAMLPSTLWASGSTKPNGSSA
jgi:hypothetical protein